MGSVIGDCVPALFDLSVVIIAVHQILLPFLAILNVDKHCQDLLHRTDIWVAEIDFLSDPAPDWYRIAAMA